MKQDKPRIVIDTNVYISFLLKADSVPGQAVRAALLTCTPLMSDQTEKELFKRLLSPKFDRYVGTEIRMEFFKTLVQRTEKVSPDITITDCRHANDDKFLELAVSGHAEYLVTGDKDLLVLTPYRRVDIVSPREFLEARNTK